MLEKAYSLLENAKAKVRNADHLVYVTYPVVREDRLFVKIFELIHEALKDVIKASLFFDYAWKRIVMTQDFKEDFEIFKRRREFYNITTGEIGVIVELFRMMNDYQRVSMSEHHTFQEVLFLRRVNVSKLKDYLSVSSSIVNKIERRIRPRK